MTATPEVAAQLDEAIDSLLRDDASADDGDAAAELIATARMLRDVLPRFHPRFGFEERLAGRIAMFGHGASPEPISFPLLPPAAEDGEGRHIRRRTLVAGGAIASGVSIAIPLAGAALVVWRRGRSSGGLL